MKIDNNEKILTINKEIHFYIEQINQTLQTECNFKNFE